jgi:hypothetical protein
MSMKPNDGGAAFPASRAHFSHDGDRLTTTDWQTGMTLRDYFAGQALMSMLNRPQDITDNTPDLAAELSYRIADAMLAQRAKEART